MNALRPWPGGAQLTFLLLVTWTTSNYLQNSVWFSSHLVTLTGRLALRRLFRESGGWTWTWIAQWHRDILATWSIEAFDSLRVRLDGSSQVSSRSLAAADLWHNPSHHTWSRSSAVRVTGTESPTQSTYVTRPPWWWCRMCNVPWLPWRRDMPVRVLRGGPDLNSGTGKVTPVCCVPMTGAGQGQHALHDCSCWAGPGLSLYTQW